MSALAALEFAAPGALWLLCLPAALLLLRARSGERRFTATVELWLRLAAGARRAQPGFAFDLRMLPLPLALACVAFALAQPRLAEPSAPWRVHVDLRPQMLLQEAGRTRLEHALGACETWLAARGVDAVWIADGREFARGARCPRTGLPFVRRRDAPFEAPDLPGVLWVLDRPPAVGPLRAGLFAAPRSAQPGLVDRREGADVVWDGAALLERPAAGPVPRVQTDEGVEPKLASLVAEWARSRGLAQGGDGELVLRVAAPGPGGEVAFASEADGVKLRGRARGDCAGLPALAAAGVVLVAWSPGLVATAVSELQAPEGDLAALALRLGRTMDSARLEPAGCVPVSGRAGAGDAQLVEPRGACPAPARDLSWPLLLAALVLVWLGRRTI